MSIVEKDEGKVIIKNRKNASCRCLQKSPQQKLNFLMKLHQQFKFELENMDNGMKDMLLDGRSNVNNILESLRKKFGLKRLQLVPFVMMMVDEWKVQLIDLIRNLKIDLIGCVYKISITMLNMENGIETYSIFLVYHG